jgi:hypothetical protein
MILSFDETLAKFYIVVFVIVETLLMTFQQLQTRKKCTYVDEGTSISKPIPQPI